MNLLSYSICIILNSILFCCLLSSASDDVFNVEKPDVEKSVSRFEYKMSFKGPHLIQKDGAIPFWTHSGNALATNDFVRITPSLKSQKGRLWCTEKNNHEHWQVEFSVRINGRRRIGADGLAFWYTSVPGGDGPVFGSSDGWNGLAVIMDSFDNDMKNNNPYIMAMGNDGSLVYNHESDGSRQQLGGCQRDYRNKQYPVRIKVKYFMKTLQVMYHNGNNEAVEYETCFTVNNINMPKQGYFGLSAATGDVADDHDVLLFETHSLRDIKEYEKNKVFEAEEQKKFQTEFEEFDAKLNKAKDEYRKVNPDKFQNDEAEYETAETRELKQIYEGQTQIQNSLRYLDEKFGDLYKQNDKLHSSIKNQVANSGNTGNNAGGASSGGLDAQTVNNIANINSQQQNIGEQLRQVKEHLITIQNSLDRTIDQKLIPTLNEKHQRVHESLNIIRTSLAQKGAGSNDGCATNFYITILIIVQSSIAGLYIFLQHRASAQAKKFY